MDQAPSETRLQVSLCYLRDARSLYGTQGLAYATAQSVGLDLRACPLTDIDGEESYAIAPGERLALPSGIAVEPHTPDMAGFVYSRSGLGAMEGLVVAQGVGVIDPDYRGEIIVVLYNTSQHIRYIKQGERIAQLVFQPVLRPVLVEVERLQNSERGSGGFGHSGKA